ncbi:MAG: hypothetical protein QM775_27800 [Pirellulales bacterium]
MSDELPGDEAMRIAPWPRLLEYAEEQAGTNATCLETISALQSCVRECFAVTAKFLELRAPVKETDDPNEPETFTLTRNENGVLHMLAQIGCEVVLRTHLAGQYKQN